MEPRETVIRKSQIGELPRQEGSAFGAAILTMVAWFAVALVDLVLSLTSFYRLHQVVKNFPVVSRQPASPRVQAMVCAAVDRSIAFYLKRARCLQRSAATVFILRIFGVPAQMVIGVQKIPFRAHAWVEYEGRVLNDRPIVQQNFVEMERL